MKKLVSALVLVFAFTLATQAQKKRKMHKEKLTAEQQATLAVKKMALALELTNAQRRKLKPLIKKQITEKRAQLAKMKKIREEKRKIEKEERYKKMNAMLDKKLAMQEKIKSILNAEQYEKYKKMKRAKKHHARKRMKMHKKRKLLKERKYRKRLHRDDDDN